MFGKEAAVCLQGGRQGADRVVVPGSAGVWLEGGDAGAGGGVDVRIQLCADGAAVDVGGRDEGGAAAHERVEDDVPFVGVLGDEGLEHVHRFLSGMQMRGVFAEVEDVTRATASVRGAAHSGNGGVVKRGSMSGYLLCPVVGFALLAGDGEPVPSGELAVEHKDKLVAAQRHAVRVENAHAHGLLPHPLVAEVLSLQPYKVGCEWHLGEHEQRAVRLENAPCLGEKRPPVGRFVPWALRGTERRVG